MGSRGIAAGQTVAALEPFGQGDLDSLCGLYAIINGLRLLLAQRQPLTTSHCTTLFHAGIKHLASEGTLRSVLCSGMSVPTFRRLTDALVTNAAKMIRLPISTSALKKPGQRIKQNSVRDVLFDACAGGVPLILIGGVYDHFTAVSAVTETQIRLFDSYGFKFINARNCSAVQGRTRHHIPLTGCIILQLGQTDPHLKAADLQHIQTRG